MHPQMVTYTQAHTNTVEHTLTHTAYTVEPLYNRNFGPGIFGHFLQQYRGFPLSEVKNVLVTPVGTRILPSL